jgi:hypothetical protein
MCGRQWRSRINTSRMRGVRGERPGWHRVDVTERNGLDITVRRGKTIGDSALRAEDNPLLCPLRTWQRWREVLGAAGRYEERDPDVRADGRGAGHVGVDAALRPVRGPRAGRRGLSPDAITRLLRRAGERAGLPYPGHRALPARRVRHRGAPRRLVVAGHRETRPVGSELHRAVGVLPGGEAVGAPRRRRIQHPPDRRGPRPRVTRPDSTPNPPTASAVGGRVAGRHRDRWPKPAGVRRVRQRPAARLGANVWSRGALLTGLIAAAMILPVFASLRVLRLHHAHPRPGHHDRPTQAITVYKGPNKAYEGPNESTKDPTRYLAGMGGQLAVHHSIVLTRHVQLRICYLG